MLDVLLAALALPVLAMNACADPAITHVAAGPVANNGNLTTYDFAVTLKNVGGANQPSSVLNSIWIYQDATKVDQKARRRYVPAKPKQCSINFSDRRKRMRARRGCGFS